MFDCRTLTDAAPTRPLEENGSPDLETPRLKPQPDRAFRVDIRVLVYSLASGRLNARWAPVGWQHCFNTVGNLSD